MSKEKEKSSIAIVGLGHVGSMMNQLFPSATVYDEPKGIGTRNDVNCAEVAFVCVPTPQKETGECDVSIVDSVLEWLDSQIIVLRSTVPVGYTEAASLKYGKRIVFQPEYYGETVAHPFADGRNRNWITLGGNLADVNPVIAVYQQIFTSEIRFQYVPTRVAELAKYMENAFLATKVTFCNQFYDIANALNIDYNLLRETWLMDPRIGRSHTFVYQDNRGYGGSCLPKDIAAITYQAREIGVETPLLDAVRFTNRLYQD